MNRVLRRSSIIFISVFCYFLIVEILVVIYKPKLLLASDIFINRLIFIGVFTLIYILKPKLPHKIGSLISVTLIYATLTGLYKETALLNEMFHPEIDSKLVSLEQKIWGYQPSIEFSKVMNKSWFSELMFFGYFSYYLMPISALIVIYKKNFQKLEDFGFILINSFLIYYVIFILLPAFGPQFYFSYPESYIEPQGVFGNIIKIIQENGEAKTAAFPSSHVGISIIVLIWLRKHLKKQYPFFIPTTILLIVATVYIKAHYTIDVVAGFITAPIIYYISNRTLRKIKTINEYTYQRS